MPLSRRRYSSHYSLEWPAGQGLRRLSIVYESVLKSRMRILSDISYKRHHTDEPSYAAKICSQHPSSYEANILHHMQPTSSIICSQQCSQHPPSYAANNAANILHHMQPTMQPTSSIICSQHPPSYAANNAANILHHMQPTSSIICSQHPPSYMQPCRSF